MSDFDILVLIHPGNVIMSHLMIYWLAALHVQSLRYRCTKD